MKAKDMVKKYGEVLIGCFMRTKAVGEYPGGPAIIVEICPDPEAPEIVLQVYNGAFSSKTMGIFSEEEVGFCGNTIPGLCSHDPDWLKVRATGGYLEVVCYHCGEIGLIDEDAAAALTRWSSTRSRHTEQLTGPGDDNA